MPKKPQTKSKKSSRLVSSKRFSKTQFVIVAACLAIGGLVYIVATRAASKPMLNYDTSAAVYDVEGQAALKPDRKRGISYEGLKKVKAYANHPCAGVFELEGSAKPGKLPKCTHGPDAAPQGVDFSKPESPQATINRLQKTPKKEITADQKQKLKEGAPVSTILSNVPGSYYGENTFAMSPLQNCGTTGKRIVPIVVYPTNIPSSMSNLVVLEMAATIKRLETQIELSAAYSGSGASLRTLRMSSTMVNGTCQPKIEKVAASFGDITKVKFSDVVNKLDSIGWDATDKKYLIWVFGFDTTFCGQSDHYPDDRPSPTENYNNIAGPMYSMVAGPCLNTPSELHELMHSLGAVNKSAPHSTGAGHCVDDHDPLCYQENGKTVYVSPSCSAITYEFIADCNKDDYFSTLFVPHPYLQKHWNVARSSYLGVPGSK